MQRVIKGTVYYISISQQAGATLGSTGCNGNTALHYAAQNAEADVMEELIGRGLQVGLTNTRWIWRNGYTLLLYQTPVVLQGRIRHPPCLWSTGLSRRHQACGAFAETRVQSEEGENKRRMHSFSLCCRKWDKGGKETITTLLFMNLLRHFSYYLMPTALLRKPQWTKNIGDQKFWRFRKCAKVGSIV